MLRATTLTALLALTACADTGDEGFVVINNTAITTDCNLTGATGQPFLAHGQIYAKSPTGYLLTPLLQSRLVATESTDDTQRTIYVSGANVTLDVKAVSIEHADGSFSNTTVTLSGQEAKFSTLFSGSLPPAGTINVGFDIIPVQTLRAILTASGASATDKLTAEVLATIQVLGTLSGDSISAAPFSYPVSVCTGCVVVDNGTCPAMITAPRTGNACNAYQDGAVDCCHDANNNLVCPATVAM